MTLQQQREYHVFRAQIEVGIGDLPDETLINLLKSHITSELSDIIVEELRYRAQRITDAIAAYSGDIPVFDVPGMEGTMQDLAKSLRFTGASDLVSQRLTKKF